MPLLAIIWLVLALIAGGFGIQYLSASARTNSAIHEIAGVLGLGLAGLFVGQAVTMLGIGEIGARARRLEDAADDSEVSVLAGVLNGYRSPATVLLAILRAGEIYSAAGSRILVGFLLEADGRRDFGSRAATSFVNRWIDELTTDDASLRDALRGLAGLDDRKRRLFDVAIDKALAKGKKQNRERQERIVNAVDQILGASSQGTNA